MLIQCFNNCCFQMQLYSITSFAVHKLLLASTGYTLSAWCVYSFLCLSLPQTGKSFSRKHQECIHHLKICTMQEITLLLASGKGRSRTAKTCSATCREFACIGILKILLEQGFCLIGFKKTLFSHTVLCRAICAGN